MLDAYVKLITKIGFVMISLFFKGLGRLIAVIMDGFRERAHEREELARQPENRPVPAANVPAASGTQAVAGRPPALSAEEDAYNVLDDARQARLRYMSVGQNL